MKRNSQHDAILRAVEMLRVAAEYLSKLHSPDDVIHYDEADCDGYCVADDCKAAADDLLIPDEYPDPEKN